MVKSRYNKVDISTSIFGLVQDKINIKCIYRILNNIPDIIIISIENRARDMIVDEIIDYFDNCNFK